MQALSKAIGHATTLIELYKLNQRPDSDDFKVGLTYALQGLIPGKPTDAEARELYVEPGNLITSVEDALTEISPIIEIYLERESRPARVMSESEWNELPQEAKDYVHAEAETDRKLEAAVRGS